MENSQFNENTSFNVNSNASTNDEYAPKKFKKIDILVFLACLLVAFTVWCYAHYLHDPILQKQISVNFVLENGNPNEKLSINQENLTIYGKESLIGYIDTITVYIDRNDFSSYNTSTEITLEYPEGINSHTETMTFELYN